MKWDYYYKTESDLIADMLRTRSDETKCNPIRLVKGYVYIEGFKRYYYKNHTLTPKQLTQLKRLAENVYINTHTA